MPLLLWLHGLVKRTSVGLQQRLKTLTHMFHTGTDLGFLFHVLIPGASLGFQRLKTRFYMFHIGRDLSFLLHVVFLGVSIGFNSCKHVFTCCTLKQKKETLAEKT